MNEKQFYSVVHFLWCIFIFYIRIYRIYHFPLCVSLLLFAYFTLCTAFDTFWTPPSKAFYTNTTFVLLLSLILFYYNNDDLFCTWYFFHCHLLITISLHCWFPCFFLSFFFLPPHCKAVRGGGLLRIMKVWRVLYN